MKSTMHQFTIQTPGEVRHDEAAERVRDGGVRVGSLQHLPRPRGPSAGDPGPRDHLHRPVPQRPPCRRTGR